MNRVELFYTDNKIKVIAESALIFKIACAVGHEVRLDDENTLVCRREEHTLDVIRAQMLMYCDIDESTIERIGNITKMTVYCFEQQGKNLAILEKKY